MLTSSPAILISTADPTACTLCQVTKSIYTGPGKPSHQDQCVVFQQSRRSHAWSVRCFLRLELNRGESDEACPSAIFPTCVRTRYKYRRLTTTAPTAQCLAACVLSLKLSALPRSTELHIDHSRQQNRQSMYNHAHTLIFQEEENPADLSHPGCKKDTSGSKQARAWIQQVAGGAAARWENTSHQGAAKS